MTANTPSTLDGLFPSKYLKASDFEDGAQDVTIKSIVSENMKNRDGKDELKPVIYFNELDKGLVLNKTNSKTLAALYGNTIAGLIGKPVTLISVVVDAFGEQQPAIRIKAEKPAPKMTLEQAIALTTDAGTSFGELTNEQLTTVMFNSKFENKKLAAQIILEHRMKSAE